MSLSVILHAGIILMVGGYVIFEGVVPRTPFVDPGIRADAYTDTETVPEPETLQEMPDIPEITSDVPVMQQPLNQPTETSAAPDLIQASTASMTFNLPPAAVATASSPSLGSLPAPAAVTTENADAAKARVLRSMTSVFGSRGEGQGLVGYLYDTARDPKGNPIASPQTTAMAMAFAKQTGTKPPRSFNEIWKLAQPLSANYIAMPRVPTEEAYTSFGIKPTLADDPPFLIHYTARVSPPVGGRFRFSGLADNHLIVAIDNRIVFVNDSERSPSAEARTRIKTTKGSYGWESPEDLIYTNPPQEGFNARYTTGDWVEWEAGKPKKIDILIGDNGGSFYAVLFVAQEGVNYRKHSGHGAPILPLFRLTDERLKNGVLEPLKLEEAKGADRIIFQTH
jgi:hypothetical protein